MDKVDVAIVRLREAAQMSEQIYGGMKNETN